MPENCWKMVSFTSSHQQQQAIFYLDLFFHPFLLHFHKSKKTTQHKHASYKTALLLHHPHGCQRGVGSSSFATSTCLLETEQSGFGDHSQSWCGIGSLGTISILPAAGFSQEINRWFVGRQSRVQTLGDIHSHQMGRW